MKKERVLAVVLSLAMIFACLPFQYAAAEENSSKVTIYSNDFESGTIQGSANYATDGGWNLAEKAGIDTAGKDSSYAFCPGWVPGQDTARKGWQSSFYYVPESARSSSGIYTFSFDYYLGEKISENCMYICANTKDYVTLSELRYKIGLDIKKWYSMKMEVNLDLDTYTFTVYNADGTVAHSETGTYSYDILTFVEFGVVAASSIVGTSHVTGNASKIDNFVVTREGYVEDESIVYRNNFESGTIPGGANYAIEGGWKLAAKAGIDAEGKNSRYAFCPGWVPGQDTARKGWQSSSYYLPESKRNTSGIYTITFDYYLGEKISENSMYICANADDYITLSELRYQAGLDLQTWYSMKIVVDLDLDTYEFAVYNADGTVAHSETGEYSFDTLTFIEFAVTASNSIAAASHVTGNASKIDNICISIEEDDFAVRWIGSGISTGADYFTLSVQAKTKGIEELQNAKVYTAIYGAGNKLLDVDSTPYSSNSEITSKQFQKSYNGIEPEYAKFFIWKDSKPVASAKNVLISYSNAEKYEGENGNWWVDGYDTGVEATNLTAQFRINPMTYFLEVSYNEGESWTKLDYRADYSGATEYDYPLEEREILNGTIRDFDNIFIASADYRGSVIPIEDTVFDTVTITKGENEIGYAFLAAKPEAYVLSPKFTKGYSPSYAAGYTRVKYSDNNEVTVKVPDNARYLYIYNNSGDEINVPSAVKFTKSGEGTSDNSIRIATWNIGHFSLGEKSDSTISGSDFAAKRAEFEDYIYNAINADVIALNEYSQYFVKGSQKAKDTIFSQYPVYFEGTQNNYSCNAVYAKSSANLTNIQAHEFECNKTADMESPYGIYATDYYYVTADLTINGKTVKLVSAHLAFYAGSSSPEPPICQNQIDELISVCNSYDRVVLMGDWNCTYDNFQRFVNAGYSLANTDNELATYSPCQDSKYREDIPEGYGSYDNIIYKGVTLSDFGLGGCKLSDHYAIYGTITVD